jgi:hypothetical protein
MQVDIIALAQLGGFATLGIVMTLAARMVFDAWKNGDLVSRGVWERTEQRSDTMAVQLERNTDALVKHTATMERAVAAAERQAKASEVQAQALQRQADALERLAAPGPAETGK